MSDLVTPVVHINGSGQMELIHQYMAVSDAARQLLAAMRQASPHGRDYPNGHISYHNAREAFRERYMAISTIADEFEAIALHLINGDQS